MKVFVAGAAGAIGKALLPQLIARGHSVVGMTRSEPKAARLQAQGVQAVVCDVFDSRRLGEVIGAGRPDAIIHELTSLPEQFDIGKLRRAYPGNNRVRREGTENVVAAAREAGARRFLVQSMASWYTPGPELKTENDPLHMAAAEPLGTAVRALHHMERTVLESGLDGVVLRYGVFYGPGTWYGKNGGVVEAVRRRRFPMIGEATGVYSWIHVEDAARATVAALENAPSGTYNIVDDDPAPTRDWLPELAAALGAKAPRRVPAWLATLVAGRAMVEWDRTMPGASNAKFKRCAPWAPVYESWRRGFREGL